MPVQPTHLPARRASGHSPAPSQARLLSALATLRDVLIPGQVLDVPAVLDRSALLACLSVFTTDTPTPTPAPVVAPALPAVIRPPRCNFAGFCQMCGIQGCESTDCITSWATTTWSMCELCDGYGADALSSLPCSCYGGLTQDDDDPLRVGSLIQDEPVIIEPEPIYYVNPNLPDGIFLDRDDDDPVICDGVPLPGKICAPGWL